MRPDRNWVRTRLHAWGWHWSAKLGREPLGPVGTLGRDGVGGGKPGCRVPLHPADWMRPDVLNTHRCVLTLDDKRRVVVWCHYVLTDLERAELCSRLGIARSTYYWRLSGAHRALQSTMLAGVEVDSVALDNATISV